MSTAEQQHKTLLMCRARYTLRIPPYENGARTGKTRLALGIYTGDVVEELWCGQTFRRHRYWTEERIRGNSSIHDQRDNTYSEAFYETTPVDHDASKFPSPIPHQILNAEWTNPLNNQQQYVQTHRTAPSWDIYAENYVDPFTKTRLQPWQDQDTHLDKTRAACLHGVSALIEDLYKLQRILLKDAGTIDYAGACEDAAPVEAQLQQRIATLQKTLGTVNTMCESFHTALSAVQQTARGPAHPAVVSGSPAAVVQPEHMGALLAALNKCVE